MKIHAIQTGTVSIKTRQRSGQGEGLMRLVNTLRDPEWTPPLPIYAWVIEHPEGVIVVDAGETSRAMQPGYYPRWHPYYRLGVRMQVQLEDEIGPKLRALGIAPEEVRWLVLTHLHCDHSGGLHHFPKAEILVSRKEYQAAQGLGGRMAGYLPRRWPDWFAPKLLDFTPEPMGVFKESFRLTKAGDVVLVPTVGHSPGHLSVMLRTDKLNYFFAGDTSYTEDYMLVQTLDGVSPDLAAARDTLARVLAQVQSEPTVYLPSHDPESAVRLAAGQITQVPSKN